METLLTYIPLDRCYALMQGIPLPDQASGAALFADISGFTPLTETLLQQQGARRGAEELTWQLDQVYEALIPQIHAHRGSVITFSGDAIICWFEGDTGMRATAAGLAMQQAIAPFAQTSTLSGLPVSLSMKVAVAVGTVRRIQVGDPAIQVMDVIAGRTLGKLAAAEQQAETGEVVITEATQANLGMCASMKDWRTDQPGGERFGVVRALVCPVDAPPWPDLHQLAATRPPTLQQAVRSWLLPPIYERLQAGQGQFLAEIRPAVMLFLHFEGIDYDNDPTAPRLLNDYLRWVQTILTRYEGFLLQVIMGDKGDYFYAAFGAPIAHDDDASRAVAAALDLLALPAELDYITGLRIGISRGMVHAGAYGSSERHTYGVLGDEVNLAARLMTRAEAGQILVSGRIAYSIRQNYYLRPMGLVQVKGKSEPVPVSLVQGRTMPTLYRRDMFQPGELVGREPELEQFEKALAQVLTGTGQIVRLEGVAGIGKSHLTAAFSDQALHREMRVVLGVCQSISRGIAYSPWRQVLWNLFGVPESQTLITTPQATAEKIARLEEHVRRMNPDWLLRLPLLGDLLNLPIADNATTAAFDPHLRQEALVALIIDLIQTWAREQPMLLILEDLHWMDEASLNLTLALTRVLAGMPVLLMLVQRPPAPEDRLLRSVISQFPPHYHLPLVDLAPVSVAALITSRLQAPASPLALGLIQMQAQGNPFFVEELVDALQETSTIMRQPDGTWDLSPQVLDVLHQAQCLVRNEAGGLVFSPQARLPTSELGLPESIHEVVLSRLDRLPEEHKLTLKVASVVGRIFDLDVLERVHPSRPGRGMLLQQIRFAEERDFTRLDGPQVRMNYIFKHSVTQEVAYTTLLESQQRELHEAVAATLEDLHPDSIEQIAYHYSRSPAREKTLFYLDKAARKTQHDYANETALSYYTQALALEERWQWRQGQAELLHILARREEEAEALRLLAAQAAAPVFTVHYLWGQYYEALGDYAEAQHAVEQALAEARKRRSELDEARSLNQLGLINRRKGDYEAARTWYIQSLTLLGDAMATGSDTATQALIETLNGASRVYYLQGELEQAQSFCDYALRLSRDSGHRRWEAETLKNLGAIVSYQQDFPLALRYYEQALVIQRTIGDREGEGSCLGNIAQVLQSTGDYGQRAIDYLSQSLSINQAIGNRWNQVNDWNDMGLLYQELGAYQQAQASLQRGLELSREIGDEAGQAYLLSSLALVLRDQDDLDAAEACLQEGLSLAQAQDDPSLVAGFFTYLSSLDVRRHDADQAIAHAGRALELYRELELQPQTADNLATLASAYLLRGELETALAYAHETLHILDEHGDEGPEFPQEDYFLCAQVLQAANQPAAAHAALEKAHTLVLERAEQIADPALRESFLQWVPINHQIMQVFAGFAGLSEHNGQLAPSMPAPAE